MLIRVARPSRQGGRVAQRQEVAPSAFLARIVIAFQIRLLPDARMPKRRVYDNERHAQFITFSCYKRRKLLDTDRAKRIVIGTLGSQLATHEGLCIGFVIMPEHVHCLVWFDQPAHLSPFMNHWKDQTSLRITNLYQKELLRISRPLIRRIPPGKHDIIRSIFSLKRS